MLPPAIQTWQWNLLLHVFEWMCFSQLNMQQNRHLWMPVPLIIKNHLLIGKSGSKERAAQRHLSDYPIGQPTSC